MHLVILEFGMVKIPAFLPNCPIDASPENMSGDMLLHELPVFRKSLHTLDQSRITGCEKIAHPGGLPVYCGCPDAVSRQAKSVAPRNTATCAHTRNMIMDCTCHLRVPETKKKIS